MDQNKSKNTYSSDELTRALEKAGLKIRSFTLQTTGNYTAEDAIWNYRDALAHLPHLHPQVFNIPVSIEPNRLISIFLQKLWFLRFPITVVDQLTERFTQTTFTNSFFFSLIVENRCQDLDANRCKVVTTYTLGMPNLLAWTFPLLKFILTRNYKHLMSTDIPCRERRGDLRSKGFTFKSDTQSFIEAQNIYLNNVIAPPSEGIAPFTYPSKLTHGESILLGSNSSGVRVLREGDSVLFFERTCPHEGALLDKAVCNGKELRCPWHGRRIRPFQILPYAEYERAHGNLSSLKNLPRGESPQH